MALTLMIFLPVAVCLFWLVLHVVLASRTETFPEMACLCLSCAVYLFADACHASMPKGSPLDTWSLIVSLFAGPSIIPLIIMYIQKLLHHQNRHYYSILWVMVPTMLFTGGLLLHFLKFDARVSNAFEIIVGPVFHSILAVELLVLVIYIIRLFSIGRILTGNLYLFLFKDKPMSLAHLQADVILAPLAVMAARIVMSDNLYTAEPWVAALSSMIISVSLFVFGLNAMFGKKTKLKEDDFRHLIRYNYSRENKAQVEEAIINNMLETAEEETLVRIKNKLEESMLRSGIRAKSKAEEQPRFSIFTSSTATHDENSLLARFQRLMSEEKLFLQPRLTLKDICDRLHSNKSYVSKMVNDSYHMGFPELINSLRIDYAEQYILRHREAKQNEIAEKCGFLSASSFNNTFKSITGMTPKAWISNMEN